MPKEFIIEGEIGWDVGTGEVKSILRQAAGEDIKVKFSSPGGSVFTGLKIFNLFKAYSGNVDFHLIGEAASMGSYIPLAGRRITAEPNVVMMIHNARSFIGGDHNEMRKRADITEGLSNLLRAEYVKRTGKTKAEITQMMDDETFFFGPETVDAGFVDEIIGDADTDPDAKSIHVATAREAFEACMTKVQAEKTDDYEQAAAILPKIVAVEDSKGGDVVAVTETVIKQELKTMTKEELKANHPELYAALVKIGAEAERDRVNAHLIMGKGSGAMDVALTAVEDGSEMTATLQAKYMTAGMNKADITARKGDDAEAGEGADTPAASAEVETDAEKIAAGLEAKFGVKGEE